ncbi:MAG: hypothetical protein KatS3mg119_0868 [Rhodothalassiaceae bacterium]|nr:MAG: hypothetical protein KatS3mg119_0868 [Rhodothalassiaceae bacterium]
MRESGRKRLEAAVEEPSGTCGRALALHADPVIERALAYPYDVPEDSYLFWRGRAFPIPDGETPEALAGALDALVAAGRLPAALARLLRDDAEEGIAGLARRHPVIACGSNRAPVRLQQKYGPTIPDAVIPVTRLHLADVAVFYAATVTAYGAVPATAAPCPGARAELRITWLTERQLAVMNETEGLGVVYALEPLPVDSAGGRALLGYRALKGLFAPAGRPAALAAIPQALPGGVPVRGEEEMLRALHARWSRTAGRESGAAFYPFIRRLVADEGLRQAAIAWMAEEAAVPWEFWRTRSGR